MAFKWYTAGDGSVRGEDDGSSVEFRIEAPSRVGGKTTGEFFSYNSPTYNRFLGHHREFHGTVGQLKKRANEEMAKAVQEELIAPPRKAPKSSGTAKALVLGSLAALGGIAAWGWHKDK
jgi:hypothetical protein